MKTNKYKCKFTGRLKGAIGIFYKHTVVLTAENPEHAELLLCDTHEHVSFLKCTQIVEVDNETKQTH